MEIKIEDKEKLLLEIAREVITCEKCDLAKTRIKYFITEEKPSISAFRGKKIVIKGRIFVPTYHPAACLRTYKYYETIVKDIAFAKSLV